MKRSLALVGGLLLCAAVAFAQIQNSTPGNNESFVAGKFIANYYSGWSGQVVTGNAATGSSTIVLRAGNIILPDGRSFVPFAVGVPIVVSDAAPELITPTAVSGCINKTGGVAGGQDQPFLTCTITASFAALHGGYATVISATNGLAEAALDANYWGGGVVALAPGWNLGVITSCTGCFASANVAITSLLPYANVSIEDDRNGYPQKWTPQSNVTFMAVPATLVAGTAGIAVNGAGSVAGLYTNANPYHLCITYVDVMGNEGPCSLDFSFTPATGTTNSIGFTAPAASAGAIGWVPYISLTNGTYALAYRVPVTAAICTLTKIENVINACALTNATYGQVGSGAIVTALTVNSARLAPQLGAASTTADIVSNSAAHTVYTYAPGGSSPAAVPQTSYAPFTTTTAAATTVPAILGTVQLPAGYMNFVGKTIRVCGKATQAAAGSTSTIETIQLVWDADGSNTTGAGVIIGNGVVNNETLVTANADTYNFCETIRTTVAGAGVTAGSVQGTTGFICVTGAVAAATSSTCGSDTTAATTASLNLAGEARIDVQYVHTTGTDANGLILQNLTVETLN